MAIINFTEGDKLAAVTADPGFYPAVLKSLDMKPSGSGKSINYWAEFELTDGKFKGKEIKACFNTEVNSASMLGGTQFRPASDMIQLKAVLDNIAVEAVPLSYDTDEMLMKAFDLQVTVDVSTGIPINGLGIFLPLGKGSGSAKVPF